MGCNEEVDFFCDADEYPYHEVYLDEYEIDVYEVTQAEYFNCLSEGSCSLPLCNFDPENHGDCPVVCAGWNMADTYCAWAGKRLCTEAEWEKAARGTDGRRYPWGNDPATCEYAVMNDGGPGCGTEGMMEVGTRPLGESSFGLMDMAGNVSEFVSDKYSETYYSECMSYCVNPQGPDSSDIWERVIKGGSYDFWSAWLRTSFRYPGYSGYYTVGFRCCM
jgi:formylglycine-generating enzyme required for sulfatase activity